MAIKVRVQNLATLYAVRAMRSLSWSFARIVVLALIASAFVPPTANASTITLAYTGNSFGDFHFFGILPPDVYTTSDHVSGFIELDSPLGANLVATFVTPVSFSFSDGVNTITNANATSISIPPSFEFWTNTSGQIVNWAVNLSEALPGSLRRIVQTLNLPGTLGVDSGQSVFCGPVVNCIDASGDLSIDPLYAQSARVDGLPGVWTTVATAVPEPATLGLLTLGLAALGFSTRKTFATYRN